ncbi:hypothetical protein MOO44_01260 (plasmid) [Nicoliella spurrieriana]|uniref:DUF1700 domain-containing protein n=1 Tax=Nicoliella spurrieriana TaxID=2925830 RepID=A0A976RQK0_9LACO|nr:hypothetical protein MOO44_01260 [Nicoliella spurrieriana]
MNRYIEELKTHLSGLNSSDLNDSVTYYQNYLIDGGFVNYADCVAELGRPGSLAAQILNDDSIKSDHKANAHHRTRVQKQATKNTSLVVLIVVLAIIGAPIWLPLLLFLGAIALSFTFALYVLLFGLAILVFSGIFAGLVSLIWAITHLFTNFSISITIIGFSLMALGLSLLLIPFMNKSFIGLGRSIKNISLWVRMQMANRHRSDRGNKE